MGSNPREDVLGNFERWIRNMPRSELGGLLKEYIAESNHSGWDGYDTRNLTGIRKLFKDLQAYHEGVDNAEWFRSGITNVNPVD